MIKLTNKKILLFLVLVVVSFLPFQVKSASAAVPSGMFMCGPGSSGDCGYFDAADDCPDAISDKPKEMCMALGTCSTYPTFPCSPENGYGSEGGIPWISGGIVPDCSPTGADGREVCGAEHLKQLAVNLFNFAISISFIIVVIMTLYGAMLLIVSGGSESRRETGKKAITSAIIGLIIVLAAWLVISTLIKTFVAGGETWAWWKFCPYPDASC
jgi:hypothetical protein